MIYWIRLTYNDNVILDIILLIRFIKLIYNDKVILDMILLIWFIKYTTYATIFIKTFPESHLHICILHP